MVLPYSNLEINILDSPADTPAWSAEVSLYVVSLKNTERGRIEAPELVQEANHIV